MDDLVEVTLWCVAGIEGVYYDTKIQAEAAARKAFPDEEESMRYSWLFYKIFYKEV